MIKHIVKWTGITVICFFGVIFAVAIFALDSVRKPAEAIDRPAERQPITVATTSALVGAQGAVPAPTSVKAPLQTTPPSSAKYIYYGVAKVIDGDTIAVNLDGTVETIRLIGINTPETVDPRKPVQCFGKQATAEAKALLAGRKVRIEKDPTQGDRDKYGRLLAYVWRDDGLFFNEYMIQQGYAYEYTYDRPYKYQTLFKAGQATAAAQDRGLWSPGTCGGTTATPISTTTAPAATSRTGHTFYLSTYYTSKYYYCDTDEAWKSLSIRYLKSYPSEQALLATYPSRTIHEACK